MALSPFEKILKVHGHGFHARVVGRLRELGWTVVVSPYYSDNFTDKPRELDKIAEKFILSRQDVVRARHYGVMVRLFIECKYVANPTVLWFDEKDMQKAFDLVMRDGFPDPRPPNDYPHHYLPMRQSRNCLRVETKAIPLHERLTKASML